MYFIRKSNSSLLVSGEKLLMNTVRNPELNLRGAQLYAQYFSQNIYTDQSRYMMPVNYSDIFWTGLNRALNNFNEIISERKLNANTKIDSILLFIIVYSP